MLFPLMLRTEQTSKFLYILDMRFDDLICVLLFNLLFYRFFVLFFQVQNGVCSLYSHR